MTADLRMAPAALACWAGAALLVTRPAWWSLGATAVAALAAVLLRRRPVLAVPAVCLAAIAVGCGLRVAAVEQSPLRDFASARRVAVVELQVRAEPVAFERRGQVSAVTQVLVRRIRARGAELTARSRATCFTRGSAPGWHVGRRIVARVRLSPATATDEAATLNVMSWRLAGRSPPWWRMGDIVRSGVRRSVSGHGSTGAALVPALVTGDVSGLSDATVEQFRRSGLSHLLAVSGTNVTIVLGAVLLLARRLTASRRILLAVALLAIIGFVLTARPEPSVLRAAVMGAIGVGAIGVGSKDATRALAWAVLALVAIDPWLSRQPGFVLSVCATAGIVWLAPPLVGRLGRWLPLRVAQVLAVPLAAQLATLPAVVAVSSQVSVVSVLANLAAAPLVAPATILGMAGGLAELVWAPLGRALGLGAVVSAGLIARAATVASGLQGAAFGWSAPGWVVCLVSVAGALAVLWVASRPALALGLAIGLTAAMIHPPRTGWPPSGEVMVACDIGQGDATVLPVAPHEAVVVDVGEFPTLIDSCLTRLGITRIRLLVFTHSDADHVAGWSGAVGGRRVDGVLVGPSGGPEVPGVPRYTARAGDHLTIGAVTLDTIWPTDHHVSEEPNDVAIVMRATVRGVRVLLTADVGEEAQDALLRAHPDVAADVLKYPHHGSADQSERFLDAVAPKLVTISVGADNDYGHPTASALAMLAREGALVRRTDLVGDIAVVVRAGRLSTVTH